jgi:hypothetical protein
LNVILQSLKHCFALTIAPDYLLNKDLKVIWKGEAPTENVLYLAYDQTKVTSDQVRLMKEFRGL